MEIKPLTKQAILMVRLMDPHAPQESMVVLYTLPEMGQM